MGEHSDREPDEVRGPDSALNPGRPRLAGKVVVVTGAGSGQGAAEARALAAEGAQVIGTDIKPVEGSDGVEGLEADVSSADDWRRVAAHVEKRFGRLDGLINNGAVGSRSLLADVGPAEWNQVLAVNLTGPMLAITTLLPLMPAGASIVNVCSTASLVPHFKAAYTVSKWGLRGLSHLAAMELGARGIRVNAVHPGFVETPIIDKLGRDFADGHRSITPLNRLGKPLDLAGLMIFLMSDESAYVNGADLVVDGGFSRTAAGFHQAMIAAGGNR